LSATGIALCETVIGGSVRPFYLPRRQQEAQLPQILGVIVP
jgi:hypothetical protein